MKNYSRWLWFAAFAVVYLALRVFWLDGDPGIPSLWEYGFNVTDEGYYMGAGKDKYLYGAFCDFTRNESFTYGYSPLTHWLSYAAYCVFGLSDWAWRIPFVAIYFISWMMAFGYVQKRSDGMKAFVACLLLSSLPVTLAYERMACNDTLIGALAVIAFVVASGRGVWRIFASAFLAGAIVLVKPSIWVLLPLIAAGVLSERKTRAIWMDLALFAIAAALSVWIWKMIAVLALSPEISRHGMSAAEVIRRTTTHNALPSLLDYDQLLRGFSSFPRDVCFKAFSGVSVLLTAVPLTMAAMNVVRRRWNAHLLFYLGFCAYVAGISVNNSICLHYYHPVLMFLPVLLLFVMRDLAELGDDSEANGKMTVGVSVLALAGTGVIVALALSAVATPQEAIEYFSNVSNLPKRIVWKFNGGYALLFGALAVVCVSCLRGVKASLREGVVWFVGAFVAASAAFSTLAIPLVARYVHLKAEDYVVPMALTLVIGVSWIVIAFGLPNRLRRRAYLAFVPSVVLLSFALTPSWRSAVGGLFRAPQHRQREVAAEITKLAPADSIVIGERSAQVLMGRPYRAATTMPSCNAVPMVRKLFETNSTEQIYALLDSQNNYNLRHFQECRDEFALSLIKTFKMPSFADGSPADVHFCRVVPLKGSRLSK